MSHADTEIKARNLRLLALDAAEIDQLGRRDQEIWRQQQAVNTARRAVEELTIGMLRSTRIVSPIAGHVTEAKATPGVVVAPGRRVGVIVSGGNVDLQRYGQWLAEGLV